MAETNSNPQEVQIPDWVAQRLEKFDWQQIERDFGITKDAILKNERVATQLANGAMTELIPCHVGNLYGEISLSPVFSGPDTPVKCKGYTCTQAPTVKDRMFVYGVEIYSDDVKKALCERTGWEANGKRVGGYANSNAGCQVTLDVEGHGQQKFLLSLHEPTNRIVAMSADAVKKFFINTETGEPIKHHTSKYGVDFSPADIELLINGKRVFIVSENKAGEMFSCWLQFDAAKRDVTVCHPIQLTQKESAQMQAKLNAYYNKDKAQDKTNDKAKAKDTKKTVKAEPEEKPKTTRKVGKK